MLKIARMPLVAAGLVGFAVVAATIAVADDNSSSTAPPSQSSSVQNEGATGNPTGQSNSATNPSNLPKTESGTTEQQSKAPVVDPQASAQTSTTDASSPEKASDTSSAATPDWPAPQRYEAGRNSSDASSGRGRATLGVNIVRSEDGQGVLVVRIRPGTPADQMGLRPRDRILSLNGQPVASADEFISAVRGMNPGDQVELSVDRDGNTRSVRGKLEALRESIAAGEGPVGNIIGRAREFVGRDQSGRFGENYRAGGEMQTSYEDGSQSGRASGNLEARLSRVEQQIDQLMRDVSEIRTSLRSSPTTSPALPSASAAGQPSVRGPSAFRPTPGQPPSGLQPQSR